MDQVRPKPYPIVLTRLDAALCVVVGGGAVAARKVGALLESSAQVQVISPELHPQLVEWRDAGHFVYLARPYAVGDLAHAFLAIAATNRRDVNVAVTAEAQQRGILINVADDPDAGNFQTMGAVRRGDVLLAVSTSGDSPALAAQIRRKLELTFGPEYGVLARRLGKLRRDLADTLSSSERTKLWRALATDEVLAWIASGEQARFEAYVNALLEELDYEQRTENREQRTKNRPKTKEE
jgi:precorrin-2 dehydrogenase/sirohydrochlorin ferrochelatase